MRGEHTDPRVSVEVSVHLWLRLPFKFTDIDPEARCVTKQSSYLPNPDRPEWLGFWEQIALARRGGVGTL